jgi:hypothetical protein
MHVAKAVRSFRRDFAVVLGSGFRDHTVVITVDGHEVYRRANVRTSPATEEADTFVAVGEWPKAHIEVRVDPGDLAIAADCDVRAHSRVVISLIGKASVSLEMDQGFHRELRRTPRAAASLRSSPTLAHPAGRLEAAERWGAR